jgi:hypothetical protein
MKIVQITVELKDTKHVFNSKENAGLLLDADHGIMISTRNETNGWYMIAWFSSEAVVMVTPKYESKP